MYCTYLNYYFSKINQIIIETVIFLYKTFGAQSWSGMRALQTQ